MTSGVPRCGRRLALAGIAACCAALVSAGAGSAAPLPNACTLLATVHPEKILHRHGSKVGHRALHKYGSGKTASATCSETIGTQPVYLDLSLARSGGFGGVKVTSTTHPAGIGSGATLVVGTAAGSGGPVDFVSFHRGTVYADLSANGASPASLTAVAREVYKVLP
jgi:hypothetical protein